MTAISLSFDAESDEYDYYSTAFRPVISPVQNDYVPLAERVERSVQQDAFNLRIQLISQNHKTATYQVDQCIEAKVPSDNFRERAVQHWQGKQSSHKTHAWTAVGLTIASLGAIATPLPYIALASLVTAVYAGVQFYKWGQTVHQIASWQLDPAIQIASERKKAYEKGFSYVYNNNLKLVDTSRHAVLLPHEVEYLYNRYFDHTCVDLLAQKCVTDQQKKKWLDAFSTDNPISQKVLMYVFERVPEIFAALSHNVESILASLKNIAKDFSNLRMQRNNEADRLLQEIESHRTTALTIPNAALKNKLSEARDAYHERRAYATGAYKDQLKKEYKLEKEKYKALHAVAVLPINLYFDGKAKEVRDELSATLALIARQEANAFSPYYEYSQNIMASVAAIKDPSFVYAQQPFNPVSNFQIPAPPKIEINFVYEPPAEVDSSFWNPRRV